MFANGFLCAAVRSTALVALLCIAGGCALPRGAAKSPNPGERGLMMSYTQGDDKQQPSPDLSPEQVIGIQLQALQRNDTPTKDNGIAIAFRFASPGNQAVTGPLANFILLVRNPLYSPMLNHRKAERGPMHVEGSQAQQRVTLLSTTGERAVYIFTLSKQTEGQYKDCWMTDGVERVKGDGQVKGEQVASGNGHLPRSSSQFS